MSPSSADDHAQIRRVEPTPVAPLSSDLLTRGLSSQAAAGRILLRFPSDRCVGHFVSPAESDVLDFPRPQTVTAEGDVSLDPGQSWGFESSHDFGDEDLSIVCSLKALSALSIAVSDVTATGLAYLSNLNNLTRLGIYSRSITTGGLTYLAKLSKLTHLTLSLPNFTGSQAESIKDLPNLNYLYIVNATDADVALVSNITSLTHLELGGERITSAGASCLSNLTNLTDLDFWAPKLTNDGFGFLSNLCQLTHLTLGSEAATDAILANLAQMRYLVHLRVLEPITGPGLAHVAHLHKLTHLVITTGDAGLEHIHHLQNLTTLTVESSGATVSGLSRLALIPSLRDISLSAPITGEGLASLAELPNLSRLWLSAYLTDAELPRLADMVNLKYLTLKKLLITDEGADWLERQLPNCKIRFSR